MTLVAAAYVLDRWRKPFPKERGSSVHLPPVLGQCPVCNEELTVTRLHCVSCDTGIDGRFRLSRFQRLSAEQLNFLEVFVKNRGIIKDVEAELSISYPTVRARLDDAIRAMGFPTGDEPQRSGRAQAQSREERRRILEDLQAKRITAEEAHRRIQSLSVTTVAEAGSAGEE